MSKSKKIKLDPADQYIADAMKDGRAKLTRVSLKAVVPDVRFQARVVHLDMDHVHALDHIRQVSGELAPAVVFETANGRLILADGFHRHEVYRRAGLPSMPAYLVQGEAKDALGFACMCNRQMCLKRTKADEKRAGLMLLADPEWFEKSDTIIANHVGVSRPSVARWRAEYCETTKTPLPKVKLSADGKTRSVTDNRKAFVGQPKKRPNGAYTATVSGRMVHMGTTRQEAEDKRKQILEDMRKTQAAEVNAVRTAPFHLASQGIHVVTEERGSKFLWTYLARGIRFVSVVTALPSDVLQAIGRLCLARADKTEAARYVVLLPAHAKQSGELVPMAAAIGIEIMTMAELEAALAEREEA